MEQLLSLFVRSIFVDNMIFAFFLGMCSYLAVSKNVKTAVGLGIAVTFVLIVTLPVNYLLQTKVLAANAIIEGVDLSFLSFILFIAVIAGIVQLVEMVVERFSPSLTIVTNAATTTNCTMIRIRLGIVLRSKEITTFEKAVITVTESPITIAGSSLAVTASAEQIPSTCTVTGLFNPSGVANTSLFFLENNWLIFYRSSLIIS